MAEANPQKYEIGDFVIYRMQMDTLPGLRNNVYAIVESEGITLIDAGYGFGAASLINKNIKKISIKHNKKLNKVIITHSHIDHFGAIGKIKGNFDTYAHMPDSNVIKDFRNSLYTYEKKLKTFLKTSKTPLPTAIQIRFLYKTHKILFNGYPVKPINEGKFGDLEIILTEGHSPGHICIGLGDAIFTGDHLLPNITPTQSPYFITPGCGLENYINSLKKIAKMKYRIAFPGHEEPFENIQSRVKEIIKFHENRLNIIEGACIGRTIFQTAKKIFGKKMHGYHNLLGLLEASAHLEYLIDKGRISQNNGIFTKIA